MRADQALGLAEPRGWNRRSCGAGAKGPRYYDWAWVATDRPRRQLLIRRSITDPNEIAYFYAYAPEGHVCSLTDLVKIAGTRWKVEDDFQDSKSTVSLDQTQVRCYRAWKRRVTLATASRCRPSTFLPRPRGVPGERPRGGLGNYRCWVPV
jgi:SRSO17 transposase